MKSHSKQFRIFEITGDSLAPYYQHGDYIEIQLLDKPIPYHQKNILETFAIGSLIVYFSPHDQALTIHRLLPNGELIGDNNDTPDEYETLLEGATLLGSAYCRLLPIGNKMKQSYGYESWMGRLVQKLQSQLFFKNSNLSTALADKVNRATRFLERGWGKQWFSKCSPHLSFESKSIQKRFELH